jgi:putative transposase
MRTREPATALSGLIDAGSARILSATLGGVAGRWYVSFGCEVSRQVGSPTQPEEVVGVDVGVQALVVLSTGEAVQNPGPLLRHARRMARHRRRLARQQSAARGQAASRRSRRTRARIACTHAEMVHQRATRCTG